MSEFEKIKLTLIQLFTMIEDSAIENDIYFDAILETNRINLPDLKRRVEEAQLDPERRKEVRARYSGMWQSIETLGIDACALELLRNLPPSEKPN
jgi:hypothetical protein